MKLNETLIFYIFLFCVIVVLVVAFSNSDIQTQRGEKRYVDVSIGDKTVRAEVADTQSTRARGLMGRASLSENEGMIFIFDNEDHHGFWMKNMSIPIDIIFIAQNKTVVEIVENAQPCGEICNTIYPREKVLYVLEVSSGFAERHNTQIGDRVEINFS